MNKNNVYHCDIKDSNILIDSSSTLKARLIDWGLSTEYVPNVNYPFPKTWRNRPFQFNVPFSVVIFSDLFIEKYSKYLKEDGKIEVESLKPFITEYINLWLKERGSGHYSYINHIMFMLFSNDFDDISGDDKEKLIKKDITLPYIFNYIIQVLIHFTYFKEDGTIDLRKYLDNVFIKIVDIYGFIISYLPIFEALFENYNKLNETEIKVFETLKSLFIKYLFSPRVEPINISELENELRGLNKILNISNNNKHSSSSSLKVSTSNKSKGVTGKTYLFDYKYHESTKNSI